MANSSCVKIQKFSQHSCEINHILDPTSQYKNAVEEQKLSLEEPMLTVDSEAGTAITISEQSEAMRID